MSLILNIPSDLVTLTQSDDLKTLYIPDKTGVYDATNNTGGYGASQFPTNQRRTSDIVKSKLEIYKPNNSQDIYTLNFTNSTTPTAQQIADETKSIEIVASTIGELANSTLPDGIYEGSYYVYFLLDTTASCSNGVLNTDDATAWSTHDVKPSSLLEIGGVIYEVDEVGTSGLGNDELSLIDGSGIGNQVNLTVNVVYKVNFTALLIKSSEKCWIEAAPKAIGDFCCSSCRKDTINNIKEFSTLIDGAKAAYLVESYDKAQEIVDYLVGLCSNNDVCVSCS